MNSEMGNKDDQGSPASAGTTSSEKLKSIQGSAHCSSRRSVNQMEGMEGIEGGREERVSNEDLYTSLCGSCLYLYFKDEETDLERSCN